MFKEKLKKWDKKNILPEKIIFEKVPVDKIEEFEVENSDDLD